MFFSNSYSKEMPKMARKLYTFGFAVAALALAIAGIGFAADAPVVVGGACADDCGHKVCRPTVETKKVSKTVYTDVCEDFCLPRCSFHCLFGHRGCCDDGCCAEGKCGRVRTKKYLIVKTRQEEHCVTKCVVEQEACPHAPACTAIAPATGRPLATSQPQSAAPLEPERIQSQPAVTPVRR